jgi:DNA (cytosine-5)-methyltransferase 1
MAIKRLVAVTKTKVGTNRGAPRIYIEGVAPGRAGFSPGMRFTLIKHERGNVQGLILRIDTTGNRQVSQKIRNGREKSVIDINSCQALDILNGHEEVRVIMRVGEIWILPSSLEIRRRARLARLAAEIASGELSTAEVSHGIGVMANAIHEGLKEAELNPRMSWAIEIEDDSLEQAMVSNSAWSDDTVPIAMPLQEVAFSDTFVRESLSPVSMLNAGLPCTAASVAGRAKKRLAKPEDDAKAGHLVMGFLAIVAQSNPAVMILENVIPFWGSAGAAMLRTQLRELGYEIHQLDLIGSDFAIESRVRRVTIAVTRGLVIDAKEFRPDAYNEQPLSEVLESVALDDSSWSRMDGLKAKEQRDIDSGKGFRMEIANYDTTHCGMIGRGYSKCRSTEVKIAHPTQDGLLRQLTPIEHCRVKGIPEVLIEGAGSATRCHEMLGQSVIWPAFKQLAKWLGTTIIQSSSNLSQEKTSERSFELVAA